MKKVKILFLLTLMFGLTVLTACQMTYECSPAPNWLYDETGHWHPCAIPSCDLQYDLEEHTYSEWEEIKAATEDASGIRERYCTVCSYIDTEEVEYAPHVHADSDYSYDETEHWHECDDCEEIYEVAEHEFTWSVKTPATCEVALVEEGVCICGYTTTKQGEKLQHSLTDVAAVEATCTEAGNVAYKHCSSCNKNYDAQGNVLSSVVIDALGHDEVDHAGQAATCTEAGWKAYVTCSRCDYTTYEAIAALGHTLTDVAAKDAVTCGEKGNIAHKHCSVCNKNFDDAGNELTDEQVYITLEHSLSDVAAKDATCAEAGNVAYKHCSACGKNLDANGNEIADVVIPATGEHTYGAWVDKEDTQERECSVCHKADSRPLTDLWDKTSMSTSLAGKGTEAEPYLIESGADLAYFQANAASIAYAKLTRNIDVDGYNFMVASYAGTLDGNGYAIKGLAISNAAENTGLFQVLEAAGVVKNLTVYGSVSGARYTAAFAGKSYGTIDNCVNYANVNGTSGETAGIVGLNEGVLTNCINNAEFVKSTGTWSTGGIAGISHKSIIGCKNYAAVTGAGGGVGGITGELAANKNIKAENCENHGNIVGAHTTGGIAGYGRNNVVNNCKNFGSVTGTDTRNWAKAIGGIVGGMDVAGGSITNCENSGTITNKVGGIGGIIGTTVGSISECSNSGTINSVAAIAGGIAGQFGGPTLTNSTNTGKVNGTTNVGGIVGKVWIDGTGTITDCTNNGEVNASQYIVGGIAGSIDNVELINCVNNNTVVAPSTSIGGIVGAVYANGKITNCTNNAAVTANGIVGGIAGETKGIITGCTNNKDATITGAWNVAGIVGKSEASIIGCKNYAAANGTSTGVAGIVGELLADKNAVVENCENHGAINGTWGIGGIVGYLNNNSITGCLNTGDISGTGETGGIAGSAKGSISNSNNTGTITVTDCNQVPHGITSSTAATITDCENSGALKKNHKEVTLEAVAPTCTETGLTEGKQCSVCNEVLKAQTTIEAKGHSYDNGVMSKADYARKYTCSECDDIKLETTVTIYFVDDWQWGTINIWIWNAGSSNTSSWPGVAMKKCGTMNVGNGIRNVYSYTITLSKNNNVSFLFNHNGDEKKSPDVTSIYDLGSDNCYYMFWDGSDKVKTTYYAG